jgi:hypothetical protein
MNKIISTRNYLPVYALIILTFNVLFLFIPLLNSFGYEFSAVNALVLSFLSGIYAVQAIKKDELNLSKNLFSFFSLILLPLLIILFYSLFNRFCSFWDGLLFYLVIAAPSVIIGASLGLVVQYLIKRYHILFFILLYISILLIPLIEFYYNPQIYFFNPLFGFFPGTIYDEGLSVSSKLFYYRIFNLLYFSILLVILIKYFLKKIFFSRKVFVAISAIIPSLFLYFSPQMGFSTTDGYLQKELGAKVESTNFIIFFDEQIDTTFMKAAVLHHEFYFLELKKFFEDTPDEKIISYVFRDNEQKKSLFGSGNADVAKPWLKQIYTSANSYNSTLKHEIAHIFSGNFGWVLFRTAEWFSPFLIEGVASAADPYYGSYNIDYLAAIGMNNNYKLDLNELFRGLNFFGHASSLSYVYSGSFSKYLIDNYGISKFKLFYTDINLEKIYNMPEEKIFDDYFNYLSEFNAADKIDAAHYYFGRPTIFSKTCPRYIASRLDEAWTFYNDGEYEKASKLFNEILEYGDNYSAVTGLSYCLEKLDKTKEAQDLILKYLPRFLNSSYYYNLEYRLADLYSLNSNVVSADSIYAGLINKNISYAFNFAAQLRGDLLRENLINEYLKGNHLDKYLILKELNSVQYNFYTFPLLAEFSKILDEDYNIFLKQFNKTIIVNDFASSYAIYKLSEYLIENLDFNRGRKMAALSLRYTGDHNMNLILDSHYKKTNWFYYNSGEILENLSIKLIE